MNINKNLQAYLETTIRNIYSSFDRGHDIKHFDEVYNFVKECTLSSDTMTSKDAEMLLTAAAFHDTGRVLGERDHELNSCNIISNNFYLKQFFDKDEITKICTIIKNHRSKYKVDDEFSLILKDADSISAKSKDRYLERLCYYVLDNLEDRDIERLVDIAYRKTSRKPAVFVPKSEIGKKLYTADYFVITRNDIRNTLQNLM